MSTYNASKVRALAKLDFNEKWHRYSFDGIRVPSVTQVLTWLFPLNLPAELLEEARQRGIRVHRLTARSDANGTRPGPEDYNLNPYLQAWESFKQDTGFEPVEIEQCVFHTKMLYAGTLDRIGWLNDRIVVVDIKTGLPMPEAALQTAAYQAAANEGSVTDKVVGRYVCQVKNDGTYRLSEYKDRADFSCFCAALQLFNWGGRSGK